MELKALQLLRWELLYGRNDFELLFRACLAEHPFASGEAFTPQLSTPPE
jgi:hypothetical protein